MPRGGAQGGFDMVAVQLRESTKRAAGWAISRAVPRYRFANCLFILAHMRCGSTALANILCSRPDVSGYGESHVRHDGRDALGRLALNQMRRGGWKPGARFLFDKVLHDRHDDAVPADFFDSRAIFVIRRPEEAIRSIVSLFQRLDRDEYTTLDEAADYYAMRLARLEQLWARYPQHRRVGITHDVLMGDPEGALRRISDRLNIAPVLENRYVSLAASRRGGGGDPFASGLHGQIEPGLARAPEYMAPLDLSPRRQAIVADRYERLRAAFLLG